MEVEMCTTIPLFTSALEKQTWKVKRVTVISFRKQLWFQA